MKLVSSQIDATQKQQKMDGCKYKLMVFEWANGCVYVI